MSLLRDRAPARLKAGWAAFWGIWVAVGIIVEIWALRARGSGDTLSGSVWTWQKALRSFAGTRLRDLGWVGRIAGLLPPVALGGFLLWLFSHWVLGIG